MDTLSRSFIGFRTGDICLSAGENIGDIMIFIGRHSTIQHSCILVWLDTEMLKRKEIKVHPYFIDENTTTLSFLGLAEGKKLDMGTDELQKGLILYHPEELFINAPIVYIRALNKEYITDDYVCVKMKEYIDLHYLKMQYAYGKKHIMTIGLGLDIFGRHKENGKLCSENIYLFLEHLCKFPDFEIDDIVGDTQMVSKPKNITYDEYKVVDAVDYMYLPDYFSGEYCTHPVFVKEEVRVIGTKNEEDVTVKHPYFVVFVVLVLIILFLFFIISNYCESCRANDFCRIGSKDFFDLL